jgi:hypothetical protein
MQAVDHVAAVERLAQEANGASLQHSVSDPLFAETGDVSIGSSPLIGVQSRPLSMMA